jgi:hypothetical protein
MVEGGLLLNHLCCESGNIQFLFLTALPYFVSLDTIVASTSYKSSAASILKMKEEETTTILE